MTERSPSGTDAMHLPEDDAFIAEDTAHGGTALQDAPAPIEEDAPDAQSLLSELPDGESEFVGETPEVLAPNRKRKRFSAYVAALAVFYTALLAAAFFAVYIALVLRQGGIIYRTGGGEIAMAAPAAALMQAEPLTAPVRSQEELTAERVNADLRLRLKIGDRYSLAAEVPEGSGYHSSAPDVAAVDLSGNIFALKSGTAVVSANVGDGERFVCAVTVYESCPDSVILDVPDLMQGEEYPNGCESVTTVMALRCAGIDITVDDFISDFLDHDYFTYDEEIEGLKFGYSPWYFYNGSPRDASGSYCFAPAIVNSVKRATEGEGYTVDELYGRGLTELCSEYISRGIPVIVWATEEMAEVYEIDSVWYDMDTGDQYRIIRPVHCLLLVGYDADGYYFNDPLVGKAVKYGKDETERAYESMWAQAVAVYKTDVPED